MDDKKVGSSCAADANQTLQSLNTSDGSAHNTSMSGNSKRNGPQGLRSPVVKRLISAPVDIQGWLHKQGSEGLMLWKKRWFVLSQYCLFYYKGPEEEKLLGSILLPSYHVTACKPEDKVNRKFSFKAEHANMRTYHFAADSQANMNQWVNALTLASLLQNPNSEASEARMIGSLNENRYEMSGGFSPPNLNNSVSCMNHSVNNEKVDDKYGVNVNSEERLEEPLYKSFSTNASRISPLNQINQMCTVQTESNHLMPCYRVSQLCEQNQQKSQAPSPAPAPSPPPPPPVHMHQITVCPQSQYNCSNRNYSPIFVDNRNQNNQKISNCHHLYVNAPPKPKRLTDASIYDDYSKFIQDGYSNINSSNVIQQPCNNVQDNAIYSAQIIPQSTNVLKEDGSNFTYQPTERRTPDTYGRNTVQDVPRSNKDYEDIYYGYTSYQKPVKYADCRNSSFIPNTTTTPMCNESHYGTSNSSTCKKSSSIDHEKNLNSPPRPHSADFLDYDVEKNLRHNKDNILSVQSQPQRPKSSLDITENKTNNNDGFFYSEERYAAQMRQSSVFFHQTPQYHQNQRNQSLSYTSTPIRSKTKDFSDYEQSSNSLCLHSSKDELLMNDKMKRTIREENDNVQLFLNRNGSPSRFLPCENEVSSITNNEDFESCMNYSTYSSNKNWNDRQFMRSASARLPKNRNSNTDHVFDSSSGSEKNSRDRERRIQQREESMKRLLEWKQRMLQSPLTRKPCGTSNKNKTDQDLSTCYKRQALLDLVAHEASIEAQYKQLDDYHVEKENLDESRQSIPYINRYSSYSSDGEEPVDVQQKLIQRSSSKSQRSINEESRQTHVAHKNQTPLRSSNDLIKGKIANFQFSDDTILPDVDYEEVMYRSTRMSDRNMESSSIIRNNPSVYASDRFIKTKLPSSKGINNLYQESKKKKLISKFDESNVVKEFSYQYINSSEKVVEKISAKPPDKYVQDKIVPSKVKNVKKDLLIRNKIEQTSIANQSTKSSKLGVISLDSNKLNSCKSDKEKKWNAVVLGKVKFNDSDKNVSSVDEEIEVESNKIKEVSNISEDTINNNSDEREFGNENEVPKAGNMLEKIQDDTENTTTTTTTTTSLSSEEKSNINQVDSTHSCETSDKLIVHDDDNGEDDESNDTQSLNINHDSNFENYYLPMSPRKSILDPNNDNRLSPDIMKSSYDYLQNEESSYVEMSQNGKKHPLLAENEEADKIDALTENLSSEISHYELICIRDEPVYMEVSQLIKSDDTSLTNFLKADDNDSISNDYSVTGILKKSKSDSSDADDESSKDLDSIDTPSHPRFSLSDTFRPASYYLGTNRNFVAELHDSSDSELVSPPPIPTHQLNDDLDCFETQEVLGLKNYSQMSTDENYFSSSKISNDSFKDDESSQLSLQFSDKYLESDLQSNKLAFKSLSQSHGETERKIIHETQKQTEQNSLLEKYYELETLKNQVYDGDFYPSNTNEEGIVNKISTTIKTDEMSSSSDITIMSSKINLLDIPFHRNSKIKTNSVSSLPSMKVSEILPCHQHSQSFSGENAHYENIPNFSPVNIFEKKRGGNYTHSNQSMQNRVSNSNYLKPSTISYSDSTSSTTDQYSRSHHPEFDRSMNYRLINDSFASTNKDSIPIPLLQTIHPTQEDSNSESAATAPYYYSDLQRDFEAGLYSSNNSHPFIPELPQLNNQRNQHTAGPVKRSDISRLVNPIAKNPELENINERNENLDDSKKSPHSFLKKQNFYKIVSSQQVNLDGEISNKILHNTETVDLNSDDFRNYNEGQVHLAVNHRRSKSLDFLDDVERQNFVENYQLKDNDKECLHRDQNKNASNMHINSEYINGEDPWEQDVLWRESLRRVSLRHAKSLDNLDVGKNSKNADSTESENTSNLSKDEGVYYHENQTLNSSYSSTYNENTSSIRNTSKFHMFDLIKDSNDCSQNSLLLNSQVNNYGWNINNELPSDDYQLIQKSQNTLLDNNVSNNNRRSFEFDREKLRQWDLLSSACLLQGQRSSSIVESHQESLEGRVEYEQTQIQESAMSENVTTEGDTKKLNETKCNY